MDILTLDQGSEFDSDSKIVGSVSEEACVRFVVFERQVLGTSVPSDCFCHCRDRRATPATTKLPFRLMR